MHKKQAFTLIELMIVMTITAMLIAFALYKTPFLTISVRTELDLLYQACRYMQQHARITHKQQELSFDLKEHCYRFNNRCYTLPKQVRFGIIAHVKGPPSTPTKPLETCCSFKNNAIQFYPEGIIDAGAIYLTNEQQNVLYALTVSVSPYSYLRTYCYADTWRLLN